MTVMLEQWDLTLKIYALFHGCESVINLKHNAGLRCFVTEDSILVDFKH